MAAVAMVKVEMAKFKTDKVETAAAHEVGAL
jgi:hypothetical protein